MKNKRAVDPEQILPEVEKMIYKLSHRYSRAYPVPYEDCLSEAYMAFMTACNTFNPHKTQISSWVYSMVNWKLKDLVIRRSRDRLDFIGDHAQELLEADDTNDNTRSRKLKRAFDGFTVSSRESVHELISDLSEDTQDMVTMLLETPRELIGLSMTPKQYLKRIKNHMRNWGYSKHALDKAEEELSTRFAEQYA